MLADQMGVGVEGDRVRVVSPAMQRALLRRFLHPVESWFGACP
jgi:hypothetical protein